MSIRSVTWSKKVRAVVGLAAIHLFAPGLATVFLSQVALAKSDTESPRKCQFLFLTAARMPEIHALDLSEAQFTRAFLYAETANKDPLKVALVVQRHGDNPSAGYLPDLRAIEALPDFKAPPRPLTRTKSPSVIEEKIIKALDRSMHTPPHLTAYERKQIEDEIYYAQVHGSRITDNWWLKWAYKELEARRKQILADTQTADLFSTYDFEQGHFGPFREALFGNENGPDQAQIERLIQSEFGSREQRLSALSAIASQIRSQEKRLPAIAMPVAHVPLSRHFYVLPTEADQAVELIAHHYTNNRKLPKLGESHPLVEAIRYLSENNRVTRPDVVKAVDRLVTLMGVEHVRTHLPTIYKGEFNISKNFEIDFDERNLKEILDAHPSLKLLFDSPKSRQQTSLNKIYDFFLTHGRFPVGSAESPRAGAVPFEPGEEVLLREVRYIFVLLKEKNQPKWTPQFRLDARQFFSQLQLLIELYAERELGLVRRPTGATWYPRL